MAVLVRQGTDPRFRQQAPRSALPAPGAETDSDVWEGENAVRTAGVALVLVLVGWVVGCEQVYTDSGDDAGGETGAEGAWEGGFSTQTQTVGYLRVQIDAQGRVTGGMGWIQGVESSNVKVGTLRTDGRLQVYFQNGGSFQSANATFNGDRTVMSGSGTFRAPDGTTQTVFFNLNRQVQR